MLHVCSRPILISLIPDSLGLKMAQHWWKNGESRSASDYCRSLSLFFFFLFRLGTLPRFKPFGLSVRDPVFEESWRGKFLTQKFGFSCPGVCTPMWCHPWNQLIWLKESWISLWLYLILKLSWLGFAMIFVFKQLSVWLWSGRMGSDHHSYHLR